MTQAELSTIKQEGLKINIAVINNGYLGMVRQLQDVYIKNAIQLSQSPPLILSKFQKHMVWKASVLPIANK